ncbi:MAG: DNA translocase FtsK [Verrucomicrobiota bacterium]|nr:DNA translocase FtsK [Verrucomicrobiota bacterium]
MAEKTKEKETVEDRLELERRRTRRVAGLVLFLLVPFPLLSLLSYNWLDISHLNSPPLDPPSNLIGLTGAWSVFIGYTVMGLALWAVPPLMLVFSGLLLHGRVTRVVRRALWTALAVVALCSRVQLGSGTVFAGTLERLNLAPNAGGAIGDWLMTRLLARWFSPVGGGLLMGGVLFFALLMAVGLRAVFGGLGRLTGWWAARQNAGASEAEDEGEPDDGLTPRERERQKRQEIKEAARLAKEAAREAREEERRQKEQTAAETKAAELTASERLRRRIEETKAAAAADRDKAHAAGQPAAEPAAKKQRPPAPAPAPAPAKPEPAEYPLPQTTLLSPIPKGSADHGNIDKTAEILVDTLLQFRVPVEVVGTTPGPVVTQYELRPAKDVKVERIAALTANLQMALEAHSLRVLAPIPGKNAVGIEVPNRRACPVTFREIVEGEAWRRNTCEIPLALGKDVTGKDLIYDLAKAPHLLVAGSTGSGKSVCLNAILTGLLMSRTPEQLRLILVDPKRVEFTCYNDLPHLLVPVINDAKKVAFGLRWALIEMEKRLRIFQTVGCKNIAAFNAREAVQQGDLFGEAADAPAANAPPEKLPYIVIVVDELADVMLEVGKEIEPAISRIAAKARAAGIHLILATQRPSVDVVTGTIKANIPGRIAFKVAQANDSRTILDNPGAEELIGKGDMLFLKDGSQLMRAQGAWVGDDEIERVVAFVKEHCQPRYDPSFNGKLDKIKESDLGLPDDDDGADDDADAGAGGDPEAGGGDDADADMLTKAIDVIRRTRRASTTMIQRRLGIGYTRAARLMDILEERGIIGPVNGANAREILVDLENEIPSNTGGAEEPDGETADAPFDPDEGDGGGGEDEPSQV